MFNYIDPLMQIPVGVFFAVTGYRKLFKHETHAQVWELFQRLRVPVPARWLVVLGEFAGGLGFVFGVLPVYAAAGLLLIMVGAYTLDTVPGVRQKVGANGDLSLLVSKLLCTPEAMLLVILFDLLVFGVAFS